MGPDSKLSIADVLLPDRVQKEDLYGYWMDSMMLTFAGRERSEADGRQLFESMGLELVKVWKASVGTQAVMEGRFLRLRKLAISALTIDFRIHKCVTGTRRYTQYDWGVPAPVPAGQIEA